MHIREDDDGAPSDLHRMVTYRFGRARPGQADASGPAWLRSAVPARFCFFFRNGYFNLKFPAKFKNA
jgi:hypothetical protein